MPPQALTRKISTAFYLGLLISICLLGVTALWSMAAVDAQALARQTRFAESGIARAVASLPNEQESVTEWDDAVQRLKASDQAWIEENLGLWIGTYFGHDRVYILSDRDQPVYAMEDGRTLDAHAYDSLEPALSPLVFALRKSMQIASVGDADSTGSVRDLGAEDFLMLSGTLALVSIKPIIPSSDRLQQSPGTEFLHISVQLVDENFINSIASQYELSGAHLSGNLDGEPGAASVPIMNGHGRILGLLQWQGSRPALETLRAIAPGVVGLVAVGLALLFWLLRRLRSSSIQLESAEARAHSLAFHDALTGLPNRALLEDRLQQALAHVRRNGGKVALIYFDIDQFKNVNDTLGHLAGDKLLCQIVGRIGGVIRETDTMARIGGDEFAIVQDNISDDRDATDLAERVLQAFDLAFDLDGKSMSVTASAGIVLTGEPDALTSELHRMADIALYDAKAKGRARYEMFDREIDAAVQRNAIIEQDLREALASHTQLWVAYQPIFAADGTGLSAPKPSSDGTIPFRGRFLRTSSSA